MKLKQLSVFLENKPGQLEIPIKALADARINIETLTLADTQQFGIVRLMVNDWAKAKQVLEQAGCVVNVADVVAVEVPHEPGGLAKVLELIDAAGINIEYMYAMAGTERRRAVMVMRFDEPDCALELLGEAGFNVVDESALRA